ncbi:hypothetical protein SADUNF_Sadunf06G0159400 [Salix dunnii]|uniref:Uncharacterized protein n=1 Tax=Salix dunnii TaxID=1413687 RepID=A0A835K4P6_9ROSI|nr:hypothetical protein SADUNF_Sadunf06G0159400 [Salix dunnii]
MTSWIPLQQVLLRELEMAEAIIRLCCNLWWQGPRVAMFAGDAIYFDSFLYWCADAQFLPLGISHHIQVGASD